MILWHHLNLQENMADSDTTVSAQQQSVYEGH